MRLPVLLALLVWAAAGLARADDAVFPPGSSIGLVPPADFHVSGNFSGFESLERQTSILFAEMPAEAYGEMRGGMTSEAFASRGMALTSREDFPVDGHPGMLLTAGQRNSGVDYRKWMLLFSAPGLTGMAIVTTPHSLVDEGFDAEMRRVLASVRAVAVSAAEQIAALPFTVRETERFRLDRVMAGSAAVFVPRDRRPAAAGPVFIVAQSLGAPAAADRLAYAQNAARSLTAVDHLTVGSTVPRRIGGLEGVELRAEAIHTETRTPMRIVQWIGFTSDGRYIRMVGIAPAAEFDALLPAFEALRDGVSLKDG